jgi:hypothetical protein
VRGRPTTSLSKTKGFAVERDSHAGYSPAIAATSFTPRSSTMAEKPQLPLRIPIGGAARAVLAARKAARDDIPFAR